MRTILRSWSVALTMAVACAVSVQAQGASKLAAANHNHAQTLVNEIMASDPQLMAVTIHTTPPGLTTSMIVASTLDVIGEPDDADDSEVTRLRRCIITPLLRLNKLGIMVPLKDNTGKEIGILAFGFKYHDGDDQTSPFTRAITIRDRIAKNITGPAALVKETP